MQDAMKASIRLAGLLLIAICVAHCGDSSVHIRTGGGGVSPTAGTFNGFTDQGGAIAIQVGSIEGIAFDCDGTPISETFSPPAKVNSDGTFSVSFTDAGRHFKVSGQFTDNDTANGIIDDENNQCDTGFDATRGGVTPPTKTPTPIVGPTGQPTEVITETETPTGPTPTGGESGGPTLTPGGPTATGLTPTPASTPTGASCPSKITFTGTSTNGVLDTGWTGNGHDATVISNGTVTVTVSGCGGTAPSCGTCSYTGPIENDPAQNQLHSQRCQGDSSILCTGDGDCTGGTGPCKFFFGSYLPLAAGGVSTCVGNVFNGGITGTANLQTGSSDGTASITSRVFNGITLSNPCPNCNGDTTINDGNKQGTCSGGPRNGMPCDASGKSPNLSFGTTSLDCPPAAGANIASLPIDLSNTTGTKARALSASNPLCRAPGWGALQCQCDTCANTAAAPCGTNADCPSGVPCGVKRCISGTNAGHACAAGSECPGGACSAPGAQSAANQCDGGPGSNDCVADAGTPSPNDRKCSSGPIESFCGPTETFRGCAGDGDCSFAGDHCNVSRFRDCFDNGVVGESDNATGHADPPVNHQSNPSLAALFCIGPTSSASVNSAAGLPGLGRLELMGHSTDNGTP
ncbi:MAG TPA: hypothetical protein VGK30_03965 [Candidatus Binatia bacterium]|jgi:hypothetical protein